MVFSTAPARVFPTASASMQNRIGKDIESIILRKVEIGGGQPTGTSRNIERITWDTSLEVQAMAYPPATGFADMGRPLPDVSAGMDLPLAVPGLEVQAMAYPPATGFAEMRLPLPDVFLFRMYCPTTNHTSLEPLFWESSATMKKIGLRIIWHHDENGMMKMILKPIASNDGAGSPFTTEICCSLLELLNRLKSGFCCCFPKQEQPSRFEEIVD